MQFNATCEALSIRYGQIVDRETGEQGPYWAKVAVLSEDIEDIDGFKGRRLHEFSVEGAQAKQLVADIRASIPCIVEAKMVVGQKAGNPVLKVSHLSIAA